MPCLGKAQECLQTYPGQGAAGEQMLNAEGPNTGCGGALQGPESETSCSHRRLLNPRLSSLSASAHHGVQPHWHPLGPAEPCPRVQGARSGAPAQPRELARQRGTAGTGAQGHRHRHVQPTRRRVGSRHGSFTPRAAGHRLWYPCTPVPGDPPEPSLAAACSVPGVLD